MTTISDLAGISPVTGDPTLQYFGIEIEVESVVDRYALERPVSQYDWRAVSDGSLRNDGAELISPPSTIAHLEEALPVVYKSMHNQGATVSVRTSTHVHMDMLHRTKAEVLAIAAFYSLVEPSLYAMLPSDREQGIYCVPWYRAPDEAFKLVGALTTGAGFRSELGRSVKYTGLNVGALREHGTLEFRMAHVFDTAEQLLDWIHVLHTVVVIGTAFGSPDDVVNAIATHGLAEIWPYGDADALSEEFDSFYCAEILGSGQSPTWEAPDLEFDQDAEDESVPSLRNMYYDLEGIRSPSSTNWQTAATSTSLFDDDVTVDDIRTSNDFDALLRRMTQSAGER